MTENGEQPMRRRVHDVFGAYDEVILPGALQRVQEPPRYLGGDMPGVLLRTWIEDAGAGVKLEDAAVPFLTAENTTRNPPTSV